MTDGADARPVSVDVTHTVLRIEAEAAVTEVAFAVRHVEMSQKLACTDEVVYLNLRTKENETYTVELSVPGFRVVGREFDQIKESEFSRFFETIYSLLDYLSPEYRQSFGQALLAKLNQLAEINERKELEEDTS